MSRNIEIKARVNDLGEVRQRVAALSSTPSQIVNQIDTFFVVPRGRLKVRTFSDGSGELIAYERPSHRGPKESVYTRVACQEGRALSEALGNVLLVRGVVKKQREVFIIGRTRVHLDQVEHLGCFVELEVVLRSGEPVERGDREAQILMQALEIPEPALVAEAYIDLLETANVTSPGATVLPRVSS
jgi:predicted adenylyl cyclase CyaB